MDGGQRIVMVTVGLILSTTLISGPLVGAVDFTREPVEQPRGAENSSHHATVQVIDEPDGPVVLERGGFGNDVYVLRVPTLTIRVTNVSGSPRVAYKVRIYGLGYTRVTSYVLDDERSVHRRTLGVTKKSFPPSAITETEYRAELFVTVHDDEGSNLVYQLNTTAVVRE